VDVVRHQLVQRIVRAYDSHGRAEQLPLVVDGNPMMPNEETRKVALKQ